MNFSLEALERLEINTLGFKHFISRPKLVMDYAEALFVCNVMSTAKVRVDQETLGEIISHNSEEYILANMRINNIQTPEIKDQYQQLGRGEKEQFSHALIIMVYKKISEMSSKDLVVLLRGSAEEASTINFDNTKESNRKTPIEEKITTSDANRSINNTMERELPEPEIQRDTGPIIDSDIPKEGTHGHDRLFAGMGDMFNDSGDVENEGFQHNLSGDEPDIDKM